MSPKWAASTKRWVITAAAILIGLGLYIAREQIPPVVLAVILAYLVKPLVDALSARGRMPRALAGGLIYLSLLGLLLIPFFFVPNLVGRVTQAIPDPPALQALLVELTGRLSEIRAFEIGPNLANALQEPLTRFGDLARQAGGAGLGALGRLTAGFASRLIDTVFVLVASFYLVITAPRVQAYLWTLVPTGYESDAKNLTHEVNQVWAGFFRGQLILCTAIGIVTGLAMALLGVRFAFWLGLIAGILEIIPNIGPVLSSIPAIILALVSGSSRFDINHIWFAIIVALAYTLIQQVENHYFVPRIIGGSVNLHPVVTLVGVLVGANLVGILGIFLAAPTIATLRVLARYAHAKLQDRDPFPAERAPVAPAALPLDAMTGPPVEAEIETRGS